MNVIQELQRVNWQNPGTLSSPARLTVALGALALICAVGWYFFIQDRITTHDALEAKEASLRSDFVERQKKAANLEPLKEQLVTMNAMLEQMLKQLPSKTQLADLLVNVSEQALAAGIQVRLFQPQTESVKEFYAEKPILLRMVGNYNQFGHFVSGVATLPRVVILTMHDIAITPATPQPGVASGSLVLEGTVKTYRYLDEDEAAAQAAAEALANAPPGGTAAPAAPVR
jgi:type IV pilus assembly protein PilO